MVSRSSRQYTIPTLYLIPKLKWPGLPKQVFKKERPVLCLLRVVTNMVSSAYSKFIYVFCWTLVHVWAPFFSFSGTHDAMIWCESGYAKGLGAISRRCLGSMVDNRPFYKGSHNGPTVGFAARIDLRRTTPI